MKLSKPQQRMFQQVSEIPRPIRPQFGHRGFQTAKALRDRGLVQVEYLAEGGWSIRLSDDWVRMCHLEKVVNNVEGTALDKTPAHQEREEELDDLYAKFRKLER